MKTASDKIGKKSTPIIGSVNKSGKLVKKKFKLSLENPFEHHNFNTLSLKNEKLILDWIKTKLVPIRKGKVEKKINITYGINAVTRQCEKSNLSLIILCSNVSPHSLIEHIPSLANATNTPLISLSVNSSTFGEIFDFKSLIVLGLKKGNEIPSGIESIIPMNPYIPNFKQPIILKNEMKL